MNTVVHEGSETRLLFVVNHVAFFVSHRLPLAQEALRRGWTVRLITGLPASETMEAQAMEVLANSGVEHVRLGFSGGFRNPIAEILGFIRLWTAVARFSPDIVHCASPLGLLYGGLSSRLARVPALVLAVSGMGYAFTDTGKRSPMRALVRNAYSRVVRLAYGHRNKHVIIQNKEDQAWVLGQGLARTDEITLVPGSGVDIAALSHSDIQCKEQLVVLPARLLKDKGVMEFVEAARRIRQLMPDWRFVVAGTADYRNPSAIEHSVIESWVSQGWVEWPGHVRDMTGLFSRAAVVCLPSYREGLPKALLEAAAAGCAVVTTDVTGCREAVIPGVTGDLVPARNVDDLVNALLSLMRDRSKRESYGAAGRIFARDRFGMDVILGAIFAIYGSLLVSPSKGR